MFRLLIILPVFLLFENICFGQDTSKRTKLADISIVSSKAKSHTLTNYTGKLNMNNVFSINNSLFSNQNTNRNNIFLATKVNSPNPIYINNIKIRIHYIDTLTHAVNCIIIQDDSVLLIKDLGKNSKPLSRQISLTLENGLAIKKGDFYIGIEIIDNCSNCEFNQKMIPSFGENNFVGRLPNKKPLKKFNTANLTISDLGIQYKIIYTLGISE